MKIKIKSIENISLIAESDAERAILEHLGDQDSFGVSVVRTFLEPESKTRSGEEEQSRPYEIEFFPLPPQGVPQNYPTGKKL